MTTAGAETFRHWQLAAVVLLGAVLGACATTGVNRSVKDEVTLNRANAEIAESALLDIWIEIFDPGELPENEKKAAGLSIEIREGEARYIPIHLRSVVEKTGYWGAVRVVPVGTEGAEVLVQGRILASDGETLQVEVSAHDGTGREWFRNTYEKRIEAEVYTSRVPTDEEVFETFYHAVANDLSKYRGTLEVEEITRIRRVAELRFAADMAPDAFAAHLVEDDRGRYTLQRLPAEDDPMYGRVQTIRDRDFLLIDTLNGHFDNFYSDMQSPYFEWRKARSAEAAELRRIQSEANKRKALGVAAILGAIAIEALGSSNGGYSTGTLRDLMIIGGVYATKRGFDMAAQTAIHRDAIKELGASFSAETKPLVVEVEGETHELTGSAETQYEQWRGLLRQIYASETGLPLEDDMSQDNAVNEEPVPAAAEVGGGA